jgi:hypothetical protein
MNLSQDSQSPGRDLDLGPPKYKAGVSTTQPQYLVRRDNSFLIFMSQF